MTKTAVRVVREDIPNFLGNWGAEVSPRLYRLDPPMDGYDRVVVAVIDLPEIALGGTDLASAGIRPSTQQSIRKTEVFASDELGACVEIIPGFGLLPLRRWESRVMTHAEALAEDGYQISEEEVRE